MITVAKNKIHNSMHKLCNSILELKGVRFAGLITNYGNLYAGGFKKETIPYESDEKRWLMYIRFALESCFKKNFDESFGAFTYSTIQREKISILTINICNYLLLVFVEPQIDIHKLAEKIRTTINENEMTTLKLGSKTH
jgi:hypothetical protein